MDSFEYNKWIGAFLGAVFVVFSVAIISDAIFAAPHPEKEGFVIEAVEPEAGGGEAAPVEEPIAVRLASADAAAGQAIEKRCAACHTVEQGGANKVGPNLWNIVNRPVASHEGFAYSGAMKEFSQGGSVVWDYEHLDHFIMAPKALVKGTAMAFAGLKNPEDRANLIAYLRTLSDSPAPLPEAPAPAPENAVAPAGEAPAAEPAAAEPAPAEAAPAEAAPAEAAPAEGAAPAATPAAEPAAEPAPTEAAPTEAAPAEPAPAEAAPAEATPEAPAAVPPAEPAPAQ
jgi:cytochrome c